MHPTRLDREKSTDQCVTSCSGAGLNLGTSKTRSRPIMSREGVNQSPYDPFSSQSRPQSPGRSHAPVGGEQRLPRTGSMPSSTTQQQARMHRTKGWETHCLWSIFSFLETACPGTYQVQRVHVVSTQTHNFTGFPHPSAPWWQSRGRRQPKSAL